MSDLGEYVRYIVNVNFNFLYGWCLCCPINSEIRFVLNLYLI
jgi:hypothetical protein